MLRVASATANEQEIVPVSAVQSGEVGGPRACANSVAF